VKVTCFFGSRDKLGINFIKKNVHSRVIKKIMCFSHVKRHMSLLHIRFVKKNSIQFKKKTLLNDKISIILN
jgi:hypothetical protein